MSMAVSPADTVKDYLVAQIGALAILASPAAGISPALVYYDDPPADPPEDLVVVGDIVEKRVEATIGAPSRSGVIEVDITVDVTITVWRGGDQATVVWKRAKAISDAIDLLIRGDYRLGGAVRSTQILETTMPASVWAYEQDGLAPNGRQTEFVKKIECRQRL